MFERIVPQGGSLYQRGAVNTLITPFTADRARNFALNLVSAYAYHWRAIQLGCIRDLFNRSHLLGPCFLTSATGESDELCLSE